MVMRMMMIGEECAYQMSFDLTGLCSLCAVYCGVVWCSAMWCSVV
jgi:hypothetical protein